MLNRNAIQFDRHRHAVRTIWITVLGFLIGFVSAKLRPHFSTHSVHFEAIVEFFLVIPLICLLVLYMLLRVPLKQAIPAMLATYSAFYFANTIGHLIGAIGQSFIFGFIGVSSAFWFGSCLIGTALLLAVNWLWPLRHASTDCLDCGYSLIGLRDYACPECGKPFTLAEQGVTQDQLLAD